MLQIWMLFPLRAPPEGWFFADEPGGALRLKTAPKAPTGPPYISLPPQGVDLLTITAEKRASDRVIAHPGDGS